MPGAYHKAFIESGAMAVKTQSAEGGSASGWGRACACPENISSFVFPVVKSAYLRSRYYRLLPPDVASPIRANLAPPRHHSQRGKGGDCTHPPRGGKKDLFSVVGARMCARRVAEGGREGGSPRGLQCGMSLRRSNYLGKPHARPSARTAPPPRPCRASLMALQSAPRLPTCGPCGPPPAGAPQAKQPVLMSPVYKLYGLTRTPAPRRLSLGAFPENTLMHGFPHRRPLHATRLIKIYLSRNKIRESAAQRAHPAWLSRSEVPIYWVPQAVTHTHTHTHTCTHSHTRTCASVRAGLCVNGAGQGRVARARPEQCSQPCRTPV